MDNGSEMIRLRRNFDFGGFKLINFIRLGAASERVRRWRNHDEVRKWIYSDHLISKKEHLRFIEGLKEDRKNYYWMVEDREGGIGVISLNKVDPKHKNTYLGIYTNPDSPRKRAGKILIDLLKRLCFEIAKLHSLRLEVIDGNERAVRFYRKMGFRKEGRLKEFVLKEGRWRDVIVMAMINPKRRTS
ncbi:MAG: UDP-4-amino-4,6-dideoxy-N-acetyl-beta-L-altrosamine N-acetyltransferase [Candidatus Manganitrophaceae bacterium]